MENHRPFCPLTRLLLREQTRFREIYLEAGFTPVRVDELLAAMHFTETHPAFITLRCGPFGSIWIQPVKPVSALTEEERQEFWVGPDAEAAAHFDVFDRRGRYLGVVQLPEGSWPTRFHGDRLYGRWRDSLAVEYAQGARGGLSLMRRANRIGDKVTLQLINSLASTEPK